MADEVFLFDVGEREYGDAALLRVGGRDILIDGAHPGKQDGDARHPSIPDQLERATGRSDGTVDLLIVSHAHLDHIGCLPHLVSNELLRPKWALVPHAGLAWGRLAQDSGETSIDARVFQVAAALREHLPHRGISDAQLDELLVDAVTQEDRYIAMLDTLSRNGTNVVRFQVDSHSELVDAFSDAGMKVLGPSRDLIYLTAARIRENRERDIQALAAAVRADSPVSAVELYRRAVETVPRLDAERARPGHLVNLQSITVSFEHDHKILFSGDMQLADPQTGSDPINAEVVKLRQAIASGAPYDFVKIGHHGSPNAFDQGVLDELRDTRAFGIIAGEDSKEHPHIDVLSLLDSRRDRIRWARTDRQGAVSVSLGPKLVWTNARGKFNDAEPNVVDRPQLAGVHTSEVTTGPRVRVEEGADTVDVTVRIPRGTRVMISVEVDGFTQARCTV